MGVIGIVVYPNPIDLIAGGGTAASTTGWQGDAMRGCVVRSDCVQMTSIACGRRSGDSHGNGAGPHWKGQLLGFQHDKSKARSFFLEKKYSHDSIHKHAARALRGTTPFPPRAMVVKQTKQLLRRTTRGTVSLVRKLTGKGVGDGDVAPETSTVPAQKKPKRNSPNVKAQKQRWMDLILSKEFDKVLDEIFTKCAGINEDGMDGDRTGAEASLDVAELAVAIDSLYKKLEGMMGGEKKLPRVKEKMGSILQKYDDNNDGKLDKREWEGFARTYFSRMEWPVWKTAARGAATGAGAFFVVQMLVLPVIGVVISAVLPVVISVVKARIGDLPKQHMDAMKAKLKGKFKIGKDVDGDGMLDEVAVNLKKQRRARRMRKVKTMGTYSAGFAAGAVAGLV